MLEWNELEKACQSCNRCGLCETRHNVVFGVGPKTADVMFIGEGPGETEDETGRPFVGKAGQLLDKMILAIGLTREDVYIANMVKCRPPKNRDPEQEETETCIKHLREQVKLISPKMIVCLGRISACRLIDPDFKVTKQHGIWVKKGNIKFMGTFHPSALLRNPLQKPEAFEDFLKIKEEYDKI
jgi:DNA polymerase